MKRNKSKLCIFLLLVLVLPTVLADELLVDIEQGDCVSVDLNEDDISDVIICYNDDESITIDDVIAIDEEVESTFDEDTVVIPSSITTIKKYELPFDEEKFKMEIVRGYLLYLGILGGLLIVCFILIGVLFGRLAKKPKRRKKKK